MFLCCIPLFFQEVAVGQYLGSGGMTFVGQLCPILKGVGFAAMTIVFLLDIYYCVIISWTIFYIYSSFSTKLPWSDCGKYISNHYWKLHLQRYECPSKKLNKCSSSLFGNCLLSELRLFSEYYWLTYTSITLWRQHCISRWCFKEKPYVHFQYFICTFSNIDGRQLLI